MLISMVCAEGQCWSLSFYGGSVLIPNLCFDPWPLQWVYAFPGWCSGSMLIFEFYGDLMLVAVFSGELLLVPWLCGGLVLVPGFCGGLAFCSWVFWWVSVGSRVCSWSVLFPGFCGGSVLVPRFVVCQCWCLGFVWNCSQITSIIVTLPCPVPCLRC